MDESPLSIAARCGHQEIVRILLRDGACVDGQDNSDDKEEGSEGDEKKEDHSGEESEEETEEERKARIEDEERVFDDRWTTESDGSEVSPPTLLSPTPLSFSLPFPYPFYSLS